MTTYRIGVSRDPTNPSDTPSFDPIAFKVLEGDPVIEWEWFGDGVKEVSADELAVYDGIWLGWPALRGSALGRADQRTRIVARSGAGYDHCDVEAITRQGILMTINPSGVRRAVASGAMAFLLSLAHRLPNLDHLVRSGQWSDPAHRLGTGLSGRILGVIGVGNIGKELFQLARPFEMCHVAYDPTATTAEVSAFGVTLQDFDTVVAGADFLVICCPLNETTRGIIDQRAIGLMKSTAFLINVARGPIVDERALTLALQSGRIAGAGLDVFEREPTPVDNPLLSLDNVILSPHAITHTDECMRLLAEGGFRSIRSFFNRQLPFKIINPTVLDTPTMRTWFTPDVASRQYSRN